MSHEPFGNRWAGAPQTARGRKLQQQHGVLRQLRREAEELHEAGPPPAAYLTHRQLLRSRNASCMRAANTASSSDEPLQPPVRLRWSAELSQRLTVPPQHPKRAWDMVRGTLVRDESESRPGLSEPSAHDARPHDAQSTQRSDQLRSCGQGEENLPPPRPPTTKAKHLGGARATTGAAQKPAASALTRAELVGARRLVYAAQEVGVAQPEQFSGCLTDCAPLSRLLLRGLPAGSAQWRYEERRLWPGEAFAAHPPLPLPSASTALCGAASEHPGWWRELT